MKRSALLLGLLTVLLAANASAAAKKPVLSSISPTSVNAGASSFTLTLNGIFTSGDAVYWNGPSSSIINATFVSSNQLTAVIPASLLSAPGTVTVYVQLSGQKGAPSNSQTFTIKAVCSLKISTTSLPNGVSGTSYSQTLAESGGTGPFTWALASGSGALPTGLSLSSGGAITGTPSVAGLFSPTFQVTDSGTGCVAKQNLPITIATSVTVSISPSSLPSGTQGTGYSQTLTASGGTSPYTFNITAGSLPPGLTIASCTGSSSCATATVSGTPTIAGTFAFTAQAVDVNSASGTRAYSVTIASSTAPFFTSNFSTGSPWGFGAVASGPTGTDVSSTLGPPSGGPSATAGAFHYHLCGIPAPVTLGYQAGGSLTTTTYYVRVSGVNANGETIPNKEVAITVPGSNVLTIALPLAHPDLTGANVYVGTSSGGETLQTASPIAQGSTWIEPTTGLISGASPPTTMANCGGASQDSNRYVATTFSGVNSLYAVGWFFVPTPLADDAGPSNMETRQRKLIWIGDSTSVSNNTGGNYQIVLTSTGAVNGSYSPTGTSLAFFEQATPGVACAFTSAEQYTGIVLNYNSWHEVEIFLNLNTSGMSNGTATLWLDGVQKYTNTALSLRGTCTTQMSYAGFGEQENRYNYDAMDGFRYIENVAIGTAFIP